MGRVIPNERSWVGFTATIASAVAGNPTTLTPTAAEITAATDLTSFIISINASEQGNTIPAPSIDSLFERTAPGTSQAQFTAEMYRDDGAGNDDAWTTLDKGTTGYIIIGRFGLTGTTSSGKPKPIATNVVEVWPVYVTSAAPGALQSNQLQTFTVTCAVPEEPNMAATVLA